MAERLVDKFVAEQPEAAAGLGLILRLAQTYMMPQTVVTEAEYVDTVMGFAISLELLATMAPGQVDAKLMDTLRGMLEKSKARVGRPIVADGRSSVVKTDAGK